MSKDQWRRLSKAKKARNTATFYVAEYAKILHFPENEASEQGDRAFFMHNQEDDRIAVVFVKTHDDEKTYAVGRYTPGHCRVSCGLAGRGTWIENLTAGNHSVEIEIADLGMGYGKSMILTPIYTKKGE